MTFELPVLSASAHPIGVEFARHMDEWFKSGVSDVTIQSGDYVWAYHKRKHKCVSTGRLDPSSVDSIVRVLYKDEGWSGILGRGIPIDVDADIRPYLDASKPDEFDPDYSIRVRANITRCTVGIVENGVSITLRTIPGLPPALSQLNLPESIVDNIFPSHGLVLVVGVTGSGKSTMLAAVIGDMQMSEDRPRKILTVEDPIEFKYAGLPAKALPTDGTSMPANGRPRKPRMPEVSQMQLGKHLAEFSLAAPNILRRKSDVIVMGEMRDKVTIETGLLLAATGHTTFATMHCDTPAEAIARAVSEFPFEGQPAIANKMLGDLKLIVAQKIEVTIAGEGKAYRSWCVFDQELKTTLSEQPFSKWMRMLRSHMTSLGQTFAQQAYPDFVNKVIDEEAFSRVAGFNKAEVRKYIEEQGGLS